MCVFACVCACLFHPRSEEDEGAEESKTGPVEGGEAAPPTADAPAAVPAAAPAAPAPTASKKKDKVRGW